MTGRIIRRWIFGKKHVTPGRTVRGWHQHLHLPVCPPACDPANSKGRGVPTSTSPHCTAPSRVSMDWHRALWALTHLILTDSTSIVTISQMGKSRHQETNNVPNIICTLFGWRALRRLRGPDGEQGASLKDTLVSPCHGVSGVQTCCWPAVTLWFVCICASQQRGQA